MPALYPDFVNECYVCGGMGYVHFEGDMLPCFECEDRVRKAKKRREKKEAKKVEGEAKK